jgi:endonuclease/exonuclease/phosphatase (EEP) superfamily protein YafD
MTQARAPKPFPAVLRLLTVLYGVVLAVITVVNLIGAEHWWLGALNLYLPQALWAAPAALLLAAALLADRAWSWLPALYLVWVLGPIMGLRWAPKPPPGSSPAVRVLTCNIKYGLRDSADLLNDINRYRPQVVMLQDAEGFLAGPLGRFFRHWQVRDYGQFVIASRLPLAPAEVRWVATSTGRHAFLSCRMKLGAATVTLFNVHFQSPRDSLNAFRTTGSGGWHPLDAIQDLEGNAAVRLDQARALRDLVQGEPGPVIIAGDLNSPDPSRVCATLREAGLQDAFNAGGRGYGYTYGHFLLMHRLPWLHLSWMRIDHIMASAQLRAARCWVGTGKASDHRPVIADFIQ